MTQDDEAERKLVRFADGIIPPGTVIGSFFADEHDDKAIFAEVITPAPEAAALIRTQTERIAELEASLQAVLRREEDANKAAFAHMRRITALEADGIAARQATAKNYARAEAAEKALADANAALARRIGPKVAVWYGEMPESNGKRNWTASLHRSGGDVHMEGFCFARSEYPDRVRYEADRMRWIIGELTEKPDILNYDADRHSGYVAPEDPALARMIAEAKAEGYARAVEDAAQYHERHAKGYAKVGARQDAAQHMQHAAAIRALAQKEAGE